ncbi:MAG: hypothetical protein M3442_08965, partial [Chloroflexota bacterium]|nr:hypothetical protein [Chloroflexota bacterium]
MSEQRVQRRLGGGAKLRPGAAVAGVMAAAAVALLMQAPGQVGVGVAGVIAAAVIALVAARHFAGFVLAVIALRPLVGSEDGAATTGSSDAGALLGVVFIVAAAVWLTARWRTLHPRTLAPLAVTAGALTLIAAVSVATSCCPLVT